jgi:hypothetical protein
MVHLASPAFVDLSALLSSASDQALLADPALRALMVEYSCYEVHFSDWHSRQPPRRQTDFNDWIIEGRALFDGLDELKEISYSYLRRDRHTVGVGRRHGKTERLRGIDPTSG